MPDERRSVVLGSRSPRRRELLELLVPDQRVIILPPLNPEEPGFDGLTTDAAIEQQLLAIARGKHQDVLDQPECPGEATIITADTTIVVGPPGQRLSLGQPPMDETYRPVLRQWFRDHYFGRWHTVLTGVVVSRAGGSLREQVVATRIRMIESNEPLLEWYLQTDEPQGKAGGYALQGLGSVFITAVEGSLSNVVGLPLEALRKLLHELNAA